MKYYIPPQLKNLAIAFAVFISLFLLLRHFLVPDTFGDKGFYRSAALSEIASLPVRFSGDKLCFECHQEIEDAKKEDHHQLISCETCHGPGMKHTESADAADIKKPTERESCGICHSRNYAKKSDVITQIDINEHNPGSKCIECHNPHQPWKIKE